MSSVVIKVKTNSASPGREGGIIDDLRCMMLVSSFIFLFVHFENIGELTSKASAPTTTPLCWQSTNPARFIFYHLHSTDFGEKNRGSVNRPIVKGHFHDEDIGLQLPNFNSFCFFI